MSSQSTAHFPSARSIHAPIASDRCTHTVLSSLSVCISHPPSLLLISTQHERLVRGREGRQAVESVDGVLYRDAGGQEEDPEVRRVRLQAQGLRRHDQQRQPESASDEDSEAQEQSEAVWPTPTAGLHCCSTAAAAAVAPPRQQAEQQSLSQPFVQSFSLSPFLCRRSTLDSTHESCGKSIQTLLRSCSSAQLRCYPLPGAKPLLNGLPVGGIRSIRR
jgi:hypothetical protein